MNQKHVDQKYLDEIEDIVRNPDSLRDHWDFPVNYSGLFGFPGGSDGCLTMIHKNAVDKSREYVVIRLDGTGDLGLTREIEKDDRLHNSVEDLVDAVDGKNPDEIREILMPYAEWQTRLAPICGDRYVL